MLETISHWQLDVDRGPDWLFVRISPPDIPLEQLVAQDATGLAEAIWDVMHSSFCYRVVLDMQNIALLNSTLVSQLIMLSKRVLSHNGLLRLCNLNESNQDVLHTCRLENALPNFANRGDAVMGHRPMQPR